MKTAVILGLGLLFLLGKQDAKPADSLPAADAKPAGSVSSPSSGNDSAGWLISLLPWTIAAYLIMEMGKSSKGRK